MRRSRLKTSASSARQARRIERATSPEVASDRRKGVFLIAFAIASAAAMAVAYVSYDEISVVKETNCREDGLVPAHYVLLVDATDKVPHQYATFAKDKVAALQDALPMYGKFTMLTFSGDKETTVTEVFSKCNPGRGFQVNAFMESPKVKDARWNAYYWKPIEVELMKLEKLPQADRTPLLEVLEDISSRSDFSDQISDRRLIVISDLLQYTKSFSQYSKDKLEFDDFEDTEYYQDLNVNLSDVTVELKYIKRKSAKRYQGKKHREFWSDLFDDADAKSVVFD